MPTLTKAQKAAATRKANAAAKAAQAAQADTSTQATAPKLEATEAPAPLASFTRAQRNLVRDEKTVAAGATNYNAITGRDDAYTALFGAIARLTGNASVSIADIIQHAPRNSDGKPVNPLHAGSNKASDGGAINRLCKAGRFTKAADGKSVTVTATGKALACYTSHTLTGATGPTRAIVPA